MHVLMRIHHMQLNRVSVLAVVGTLGALLCIISGQAWAESVHLAWDPPVGTNISGYSIYRAANSGGPYTRLSPSPWPLNYYVDDTAEAGQSYYYAVTVVDTSGWESAFSQEVSLALTAYAPSNAGVSLAVRAISDVTVEAGETVLLSSSIWNPESRNLTYLWAQTPRPTIDIAGTDKLEASFFAPIVPQDTELIFVLTVKDSTGVTVYDTTRVIIRRR